MLYILKIKGTKIIPDFVQIRDENMTLIAYFRLSQAENGLKKNNLENNSDKILKYLKHYLLVKCLNSKNKLMIIIENLNIYQENHQIFDNVSLKISNGEFVYLIGDTGSGKSSLLKSLYAEIKPKSGSIKSR